MSSHIPLALSLLQSFATQYPGGKQLWTPPSVATPAAASTASQSPPTASPSPSAPITILANPNPQGTSTASSAAAASISTSPPTSTAASNLCEVRNPRSLQSWLHNFILHFQNCQLRPKFSDGTKTHPYCSKSCANQAKLPSQPPGLSTSIPKSANCDVRLTVPLWELPVYSISFFA